MTKNEGRRYWQEIQITASDKERRRRRSPPLIQEINPGVRCTQKNFVKLYTPSVKSKKNTRYSLTKTSAKTTRSVKESSRRGVRTLLTFPHTPGK